MSTLTTDRIATLLAPYLGDQPPTDKLYSQLSSYLDLLIRWNARTNLTSIRNPEDIVTRHFGESIFTATKVDFVCQSGTLLDFGSGAGFPGLPIQLLLPGVQVTLAESQGKKASFLREVIRTLNLPTEVWAARVETMPPDRRFDIVTMRAVDNMSAARAAAIPRVAPGGYLVTLCGVSAQPTNDLTATFPIPNTAQTQVMVEPIASILAPS